MNKNKIQNISKRRVIQLSATFFICCLVALSSCKKEESNIGDSLQGES